MTLRVNAWQLYYILCILYNLSDIYIISNKRAIYYNERITFITFINTFVVILYILYNNKTYNIVSIKLPADVILYGGLLSII